jgi:hypothetical protein
VDRDAGRPVRLDDHARLVSVYELPETIPNNYEVNVSADINDWLAGLPSGGEGEPVRVLIPEGTYRCDQTITVANKQGWYVEQHGTFRTDDHTGDGSPRATPSRAARNRAHVRVQQLSSLVWDGLAVVGPNKSWEQGNPHYRAVLEAQHGIDVQNSGVEVLHANISDVWGDFGYYGRAPGDRTPSAGRFHDSECSFNGRQALSAVHCSGVEFDHLTLRGVMRSYFDLEPASSSFAVDHVSIHDIDGWGAGLNFLACGSSAPVSYVEVADCIVHGGVFTAVVNGAGTTKAHFAFYRNAGTTRFGSLRPAALSFGNVEDIIVAGNRQPMVASRGNYGVSFNNCLQGFVLWNEYVGARAATYMYPDTGGGSAGASVSCQSEDNRIVAGGPFDAA